MLSQKELRDGASRKLLHALCREIVADPRIGEAIDSVPEQHKDHVLIRIRELIRDNMFRLTRI